MAGAVQVVEDQSYVTLATNDTYALGALVLGNSLRRVNTNRRLTVMITGGVTQPVRQQLSSVFDVVTEVNVLDSRDTANLALLTRPDLGVTFTKFHCWRLTQFSKCVFLDADTLVLQNVDELFDREEISAAPDAGWPDCFNSGVFVYTPSEETYNALLQFAVSQGSFDGGDQGLLNMYFRDWSTKDIAKHLPFIYNVVSQAFYSYLPAFRYYEKNVKIAHFIGATKPWHHAYNTTTNTVDMKGDAGHHAQFLQLWWQIFMTQVKPGLDPALMEIEGGLAQLKLIGDGRDAHQSAKKPDSPARQFSWERGQIDYMGVDSFANIQMKLEESLNNKNKKAEATGEKVATKTTKPAPVPASASPTPPVVSAQKPLKSALKKT